MAGVGAVAAGAAAVVPSSAGAAPKVTGEGPLVAYIEDVRSGTLSLLVGDREVVVTDRALVARIANAAGL